MLLSSLSLSLPSCLFHLVSKFQCLSLHHSTPMSPVSCAIMLQEGSQACQNLRFHPSQVHLQLLLHSFDGWLLKRFSLAELQKRIKGWLHISHFNDLQRLEPECGDYDAWCAPTLPPSPPLTHTDLHRATSIMQISRAHGSSYTFPRLTSAPFMPKDLWIATWTWQVGDPVGASVAWTSTMPCFDGDDSSSPTMPQQQPAGPQGNINESEMTSQVV